jgi:hypothetical protein
MTVVFPVLQLSDDSITGFLDEDSFRRALALTTDKAIKAGFFKKARLIDANLVDHRVEQLELAGRSGLLGWMERGREIKQLKLASEGQLDLDQVKDRVVHILQNSSFWAENDDVPAMIERVRATKTFAELVAMF